MKRNRRKIPDTHNFMPAILLLAFTMMLSAACGKEEYPDTQMGIDGYVYASREIQKSPSEQTYSGSYLSADTANSYSNFTVSGDYLYYCRESYSDCDMMRILIPSDGTDPVLEKGESLFPFTYYYSRLPEKTSGAGEETELRSLLSVKKRDEGIVEGSFSIPASHTHFYFFLHDYGVDSKQNLYTMERLYTGTEEEMEENGGVLCMRSPEGEPLWQKYLPGYGNLAIDSNDNVVILTGNKILTFDSQGRQTNTAELKEYQPDKMSGTLISAGGYLYISILHQDIWEKKFYEVDQDCRLQEIKALSGQHAYDAAFGTPEGNLLLTDSSEGRLYEYDREKDSVQPLLRWEDSSLIPDMVTEIVRLKDGTLLARHYGSVYLLEKTPVEELPEKELIVLASLYPENDLRTSVIEFNRHSSKYHVIIEEYGAGSDGDAAKVRLDGKLISANPPDLLDMSGLDIYKYAEKEMLEDLNALLEKSDVLNREDFLANVLEGYTIQGKLVCIPRSFVASCVAGRASQLGRPGSWTMEDVYALTEQYPESELFDWLDRDFLLENFCSDYYLDTFVDCKEGTCSFDSSGFCRLLEWTNRYPSREGESNASIPKNVLLTYGPPDFFYVWTNELCFGEEICLKGFPDTDGRGGVYLRSALGEIGIVSNAAHKEGAAAFLEYYLSRSWGRMATNSTTRRDFLQAQFEKAVNPDLRYDSNGEPIPIINGVSQSCLVDGESYPYLGTPRRLAEQLMDLIEAADFAPRTQTEKDIITIVLEEAVSFYDGSKTAEETAAVIQRRAELLMKERAL